MPSPCLETGRSLTEHLSFHSRGRGKRRLSLSLSRPGSALQFSHLFLLGDWAPPRGQGLSVFSVSPASGTEPGSEEGKLNPWLLDNQIKPSSPPPKHTDSSGKPFIYSQELCQLPHFSHQCQEEVPRLVELLPVSFSSKLSMEAAAGTGETGVKPRSQG